MGAVQHTQLRGFVRRDVIDDHGAGLFPCRTRGAEPVLDHPLFERLGFDMSFIAHAEHASGGVEVFRRRRRRNPVHHGFGAGDVAVDEPRKVLVERFGVLRQRAVEAFAV